VRVVERGPGAGRPAFDRHPGTPMLRRLVRVDSVGGAILYMPGAGPVAMPRVGSTRACAAVPSRLPRWALLGPAWWRMRRPWCCAMLTCSSAWAPRWPSRGSLVGRWLGRDRRPHPRRSGHQHRRCRYRAPHRHSNPHRVLHDHPTGHRTRSPPRRRIEHDPCHSHRRRTVWLPLAGGIVRSRELPDSLGHSVASE